MRALVSGLKNSERKSHGTRNLRRHSHEINLQVIAYLKCVLTLPSVRTDWLARAPSHTHTHTYKKKIVFLLVQKVKTCQGLSQGNCPPTPPAPHRSVHLSVRCAPNCPCNLFLLKHSCNLQRVKTPKDIEKLHRIPIFQGSSKRCSVYIMAIWTILYYI